MFRLLRQALISSTKADFNELAVRDLRARVKRYERHPGGVVPDNLSQTQSCTCERRQVFPQTRPSLFNHIHQREVNCTCVSSERCVELLELLESVCLSDVCLKGVQVAGSKPSAEETQVLTNLSRSVCVINRKPSRAHQRQRRLLLGASLLSDLMVQYRAFKERRPLPSDIKRGASESV